MAKKRMRSSGYQRRSYFVDEEVVRKARVALGVSSDAEAVRTSLKRTVEMERFRRYLKRSRGILKPGSFEAP